MLKKPIILGMVSGKNTDKFEVTGLTPVKSEVVDAPYIREFPVVMGRILKETLNFGSYTMFISEVMDLKVDEEVLMDINLKSGNKIARIDPKKALTFIFDMSP
jgi:flavin reductase (DIM6/NTAB) family NADH-FMN oxidoreductase RutF